MQLTTVKAAADAVELSPRTIHYMLEDGRLTKYRLSGGRTLRVDLDELLALFKPEH